MLILFPNMLTKELKFMTWLFVALSQKGKGDVCYFACCCIPPLNKLFLGRLQMLNHHSVEDQKGAFALIFLTKF